MSEVVAEAVKALSAKMGDSGFDGTAKFEIEDEGSLMIDADGVRPGDDEADVTLSADTETFKAILDGDLDPTGAFMQGKLRVDGDMGMAMKLGTVLA